MPLQTRKKLQLIMPPLTTPLTPVPPSVETLCANKDRLLRQMRGLPLPAFLDAGHVPSYSDARTSGLIAVSHGFRFDTSGLDVFIHARREQPHCQGHFAGDKFHLSVERTLVPEVFRMLGGLLLSETSPIDTWKVTDIERADPQARVSVGAQFTLYVKPDGADSSYTAAGLNRLRSLVERIESILVGHGVAPGQHPDSDVRPPQWQYTSYRNEFRSEREGGERQRQSLSDEPFYRLMTE